MRRAYRRGFSLTSLATMPRPVSFNPGRTEDASFVPDERGDLLTPAALRHRTVAADQIAAASNSVRDALLRSLLPPADGISGRKLSAVSASELPEKLGSFIVAEELSHSSVLSVESPCR